MAAGGRGQTWGGVGSSYQVPKWVANNNKVSCPDCTVLWSQEHALPAAGWLHLELHTSPETQISCCLP